MKKLFTLTSLFMGLYAVQAFAVEHLPSDWQLGFQTPASPVMDKLNSLHDYLLILITAISIFVLVLLGYICLRFRRKANPVPSKTTHNTMLEVVWTVIPIIILVGIAIPSLKLHYYMERSPEPEMHIKVVGYQWYWHYEYPDHGGIAFDSYMKKDEELAPGEPRLLTVDNRLVVPVDTNIKVQLTGADVIHSWAVPAFGVKRDAMPGRLNETWFRAEKLGTYYGQCSELCGVGHGFMPVVVEVVSKEEFATWVAQRRPAEEASTPESVQPVPATVIPQDAKQAAPVAAAPENQPADAAPAAQQPAETH